MKKIILTFSTIILCLLTLIATSNKASATTMRVTDRYIPDFFYADFNSSGVQTRYGQMQVWDTSDNRISYCIAPTEIFSSGTFEIHNYNETNILDIINNTQNKEMNKLTETEFERLKLIAFYGYGYGNHNTINYRVATQMLIWRITNPVRTFTNRSCYDKNCNKITDSQANVAKEMAEIESLINNHNVRPSFTGDTINLELGKTKTITDSNNSLSKYKVVSCNNCSATINGNSLSISATNVGNYLVRLETKMDNYSSPMLFGIDSKNQNQLITGNIDPLTATFGGSVTGGSIKIIKSDKETNDKLSGAVFEVYNSENIKVCDITTNNKGEGSCSNLSLGDYSLKEVQAPKGYTLLENPINFNITENNNSIELDVKNDIIKTSIEIYKKDSEFELAQGQATLEGAIYGVYDINNNLITELITDKNGYAISDKVLKYGTRYYLKEIRASEGYLLDNTKYDFTVNDSAIITKNVTEDVIKNYISILKQYDFINGNTTFLEPEENITFEIFYQNGNKYGEITTDKHGYAEIELPYGRWKFHQTNSTTGYEKIYDFYITVSETSEKEQYYNILNNALSAYLQVFKVDAETNKVIALADTTFKIFNLDTNSYVTQYSAGKIYSEFKTDKDGKFVTYSKLQAGNYKLVEISSPKNYLLNKESLQFTIGENTNYTSTKLGTFVTLYFKDQVIKGKLEVHKKGESLVIKDNKFTYEEIPLSDVTFEIYAKNDILSADSQTLYYKKDQLVDSITTDKDGYAISSSLYLGNYYLVETSTKDTHVINKEKYEFTLTEKDNRTAIVYESCNISNLLKKGGLEFTKTDIATGKAIPDAEFEIYHIKEDDSLELIFKDKTDDNGKIIINNLFIGKFKIIETKSAVGYKLSDDAITFEVKENGEIVKASMTNEKITSILKIHKVDNNGNPLKGVKFGVFSEDGALLNTYITDENGNIETIIEYGSYYYQELETLDNYIIDDTKIYFEISNDGEIIEKTVVNNPFEIDIPNTGTSFDTYYMFGSAVALIGIGVILYEKKKIKK